MSENIQSISQGTYTIGQTSATNFVAGNGIRIDEPSAGTVRIGNDETVLWEGDINSSSDKITLSEPFTNFERQGVYWKSYERRFYSEFSNSGIDNPFTLGSVFVLYDGNVEKSCTTWKGDSTTELSYKNTSHGSITAGGTSFSNNVVPFKVIGINRKEV